MMEPPEDAPGSAQWIGPYRILSRLGEGGMGVVYLAEQLTPVRRQVALKLIREERQTPQLLARFDMERQALERMNHPNIARLLGGGVTAAGQPYFAMEYVPGLAIDAYCDKKKLTIDERLQLFLLVCAGVQHAHTNGIMHRDLKPSNILVTEVDDRPVPKIIDFGLARAIELHGQRATLFEELQRILGTLAYMSPEQAGVEPEGIDARTDVYSLGALLYELLTGRLPFDAVELEYASIPHIQQIIKEREPVRPSTQYSTTTDMSSAQATLRRADPRTLCRKVAGELDWIVLKALQKDRRARYETARDFARDVERFLHNEPVEAAPPGTWYLMRKWVRRHRAGVTAGAAVAISLIVGLVATLTMYRQAEAERLATLLEYDTRLLAELVDRADSPAYARAERTGSELAVRAERLWPARSWRAADMAAWLADADAVLARSDLHAARPAQLAAAAESSDGPERQRLQQVHARAVTAVAVLDRLRRELRPEVAARLEQAGRSRAATTIEPAAAWRAAADQVASSAHYAGLERRLEPIEGLVPIGPDPDGGLMAFYVHGTGNAPEVRGGEAPQLGDAIILLLVPPAQYQLGSQYEDPQAPGWFDFKAWHPDRDVKLWSETPMQTVRLDAYLLAKYELTQDQWIRIGGDDLSQNRPEDGDARKRLRPVDSISWLDAIRFLGRHALVLPTEARWENACRAGTGAQWPGFQGPEPKAMVASVGSTAIVGLPRPPNAWGFHDMLGNVLEWCLDGYTPNYADGCRAGDGHLLVRDASGTHLNGTGPAETIKTLRGGGYRSELVNCRSGVRQSVYQGNRFMTYGVRPCMDLPR